MFKKTFMNEFNGKIYYSAGFSFRISDYRVVHYLLFFILTSSRQWKDYLKSGPCGISNILIKRITNYDIVDNTQQIVKTEIEYYNWDVTNKNIVLVRSENKE